MQSAISTHILSYNTVDKPSAQFQAIIFDMDGTITEPVFDFDAIRQEVLEATGYSGDIETYPKKERDIAWQIIMRHEHNAAQNQAVKPGTHDFLERCRNNRIPCGLLTLNCRKNVDTLLQKFDLSFDIIITREHENPKPHPAPVLEMTKQWGIHPQDTLLVGDFIHDIQCGRSAGTKTCFFANPGHRDFTHEADITVKSMHELMQAVFPV